VPVRFIVNKNGELSDVEFLVQANEQLKQEILRVMNKMPKWKPGLQNGRNIAVYFSIPIVFEVGE
jgi:protein TonB